MLVLVPTREDVLAIRSIEEAFGLWTRKVTKREVALIRVAADERLIRFTRHAWDAADDENISDEAIRRTIQRATTRSKDLGDCAGRLIGINFDANPCLERRIRAKVSWEVRYFIATVHTL
jgi:hypothetical protein